jgi:hypothetical protein
VLSLALRQRVMGHIRNTRDEAQQSFQIPPEDPAYEKAGPDQQHIEQ